jgi:hypothetical protein
MRRHFRRPQALFNEGSLFYSHCDRAGLGRTLRDSHKLLVSSYREFERQLAGKLEAKKAVNGRLQNHI